MSYDGFTTAAMVRELHTMLAGGRINKIAQPESDALLITARGAQGQTRILLSANASLPLLYQTEKNRTSPLTAPNFCMLLRKHIGSARILSVTQPGLERVVQFELEHLNDMGDVCRKYLIIELMGKHSNIIFCEAPGVPGEAPMILDSIRHIPSSVSSVREVLPGRPWFIPQTAQKLDPFTVSEESFVRAVCGRPALLGKAILQSFTGFSPVMANELCARASLDPDTGSSDLDENARVHLYHTFLRLMEDTREGSFRPGIVYRGSEPVEFGVFPYLQYGPAYHTEGYDSVSSMLEAYYAARDEMSRIRQKSADLRHVLNTCLERDRKKYSLQEKQLNDTEKKDKYRLYGELLNAYGYSLPEGGRSVTVDNYYTNEPVSVPLDPTLSIADNARKYFDRYGKLKRTQEALTTQIGETRQEIEHLESISAFLDLARTESDLAQIKKEMTDSGYIRKRGGAAAGGGPKVRKGEKAQAKAAPYHYRSTDGYDIYVGRNNLQNDELTFKFASGGDWWFHAKKIPGSHVIVKAGEGELPDRVFEEAGALAAFYSAAKEGEKVEIDYIQRKHVKKPAGAKPGFVVYYTNYSLVASPDISRLTLVK